MTIDTIDSGYESGHETTSEYDEVEQQPGINLPLNTPRILLAKYMAKYYEGYDVVEILHISIIYRDEIQLIRIGITYRDEEEEYEDDLAAKILNAAIFYKTPEMIQLFSMI